MNEISMKHRGLFPP